MANRYHYDKNGRYTGMSSDTPPGDGCGFLMIGAVLFYFLFLYGCFA